MSSNKGNNMVNQKIKVYTLHSQKGGAGKTSIAIAIAGLSCILHKQKTLIINCDLTGISIIDLFYGVDKNNKAKENIKYLNSLLLATPSVLNKEGQAGSGFTSSQNTKKYNWELGQVYQVNNSVTFSGRSAKKFYISCRVKVPVG